MRKENYYNDRHFHTRFLWLHRLECVFVGECGLCVCFGMGLDVVCLCVCRSGLGMWVRFVVCVRAY